MTALGFNWAVVGLRKLGKQTLLLQNILQLSLEHGNIPETFVIKNMNLKHVIQN